MNYLAIGIPALNVQALLSSILVIIIAFSIITAILQWLWNITMPDVFKLPTITFWQAFRLLIIATILLTPLHHYYRNDTARQKTQTQAPVIYIGQPPYELKK